jgi:metallophosphoesterase superfamily enzyme
MTNLFRKTAVFTDIHFGLKSNSLLHNQDCEKFVDWFIATAQEQGCETGMFLGDWSHHRASINMQTLQYSLRALEKLSAAFDRFYFIPGNHDLYYRDRRDIYSTECCEGALINQTIGQTQSAFNNQRGAFSNGFSNGFDIGNI